MTFSSFMFSSGEKGFPCLYRRCLTLKYKKYSIFRNLRKKPPRRNQGRGGITREMEVGLLTLKLKEKAVRMRQNKGLAHLLLFFRRKFWLLNKRFLGEAQVPHRHFVLALERQSFFRFSHVLLRGSVNDASVTRSCVSLLPPLLCAVRTFPRRERNAHFCGLSKLSLSHVSSRFLKHSTLI